MKHVYIVKRSIVCDGTNIEIFISSVDNNNVQLNIKLQFKMDFLIFPIALHI